MKPSSVYEPWKIESKWVKEWDKKLHQEAKDFSPQKKTYLLAEFPYPSGLGLHMGHAFTYSVLDPLARLKRRLGENVIYPIGWDAFGLPTENYALKTGIQPAEATKQNTTRFRDQMKRLGLSFNWEREVDTTDPNYYKWTQWIFLQLFKHGLAYKKETPVGWCPSCKIILANEEIVNGKCERCNTVAEHRMQKQWLLRITAYADRLIDDLDLVDYPDYVKASQKNWIDRSYGATVKFKVPVLKTELEVFTTRPDTLFGATFMVLSPEHPLVAKLPQNKAIQDYVAKAQKKSELERAELNKEKTGVDTGLKAINPVTHKEIPIWISDFVLSTYGTGAIMAVPAHDSRDNEFAKKFALPIITVVSDKGKLINSGDWNGLTMPKDMAKITQWLVKKGIGEATKSYHLRDWVFSRQHYWGEPIPMIYCEHCAKKKISWWNTKEGKALKKLSLRGVRDAAIPSEQGIASVRSESDSRNDTGLAGWIPVPEDQLPVELPYLEKYQPTQTGESPLAQAKDWLQVACPECGQPARRETDTMPNWAGSSWYFLRYTDPKNNKVFADRKKLDYWTPVDLYMGGAEHTTLHVLYSRFWHKFLFDIGKLPTPEPYAARRQHGVILGEDNEKMSKSRGNVVNPEEVTKKFGADTLRIYLMFMGPYDQTMPWNSKGVEGSWRFLNRIWRIVSSRHPELAEGSIFLDRKMHQTIKKVTYDIENLKHNTAIAALMEYVNEISKSNPPAGGQNPKYIETLVLLLAPFAPFIAEELWTNVLGKKFSVHEQPWPKFDAKIIAEDEIQIVVQINGKTRGIIKIQSSNSKNQAEIESISQKDQGIAKYLDGKPIKKTIFIPGKLINFVI